VPPTHVSIPPLHIVVPRVHVPVIEPQDAPPPGLPSSVEPSQSLSRPSQISVVGPVAPVQTNAPPTHVFTPGLHVPTDGGDVEVSVQLSPGVGFYASETVLIGGRFPFAWYPTESGASSTFLAFEPYGRFDVSDSAFLNARFTLNLDEPLGFSFDDGRIWALHFGGGGTF